jgi:hypothetical protein
MAKEIDGNIQFEKKWCHILSDTMILQDLLY